MRPVKHKRNKYPPTPVSSPLLDECFAGLDDPEIIDSASEALSEAVYLSHDAQQEELRNKLVPGVMSLSPVRLFIRAPRRLSVYHLPLSPHTHSCPCHPSLQKMQGAIATGDAQLGLNLARLLSDLAGAYVDQMAEGEAYLYVAPGHNEWAMYCASAASPAVSQSPTMQTRMPLLMTVLQCTSHEDPDVALVTFSFWYRLGDRLYAVPGNAPHFVSCGPEEAN